MIEIPLLAPDRWTLTRDGDDRALWLFTRHYSFHHYQDGRRQRIFVGPGEKLVLVLPDYSALFVWRKFQSKDHQDGVNCAVFRNESPYLASELILQAEALAWERWPGARLYTYVNPRKIRSTNPGYCFLKAGWERLPDLTQKRKLIILEKYPPELA